MVFSWILTCRGRLPSANRSYGPKWRTANQIAERPLVSQSRGRATNSLWGRDCVQPWKCQNKAFDGFPLFRHCTLWVIWQYLPSNMIPEKWKDGKDVPRTSCIKVNSFLSFISHYWSFLILWSVEFPPELFRFREGHKCGMV